ncbi:MAG: SIS domain-containing protein [Candidatus Omnitrophica bacterium]|nr:SIS domain-containing protein [Candidatus Omnitrophota bacterium]
MRKEIKRNRQALKKLLDDVAATDINGAVFPLDKALEDVVRMIIKQGGSGKKLLFIGNGGSASIASHMAADFCKNAGLPALAFNDSSLLTCVSNDLGYEHVFGKPVGLFAEKGDILFAISSSGKSDNILRGVKAARNKGGTVVTLSGFDKNNPLRKLGDINFYVPCAEYGHVEIAHLSLCHCLVDVILNGRLKSPREVKARE